MATSFYQSVRANNYINTFYALNIALDTYFSNLLLEKDSSKIVYSSTDFALIARSRKTEWNNANIPFLNYKLDTKENNGDRPWANYELMSQGVYSPELKKKIRLYPVSFSYDSTLWLQQEIDYQYATDLLLQQVATETKLEFFLDVNGTSIKNIAVINFSLDTSVKFTEKDWLEQNKIKAIGLNPTIQTWVPVTSTDGFCIPKSVLINFTSKKNFDVNLDNYDEMLTATVDHFNEEAYWN